MERVNYKMRQGLVLVFACLILVLPGVLAQNTFCAERTTDGAWCQNVEEDRIDRGINPETGQPLRNAPTSCDATSFCRLGTCYDGEEGVCARNTPQVVCEQGEGFWDEGVPESLPQCSLGCCLIGNQAAFVSNQRCKRLSSVYGLDIDFRTDINDEISCLLSVTSEEEGACVFEENFQRECKFTTKRECLDLGSGATFHEDLLCTAPELNTVCARTEKTTCVQGRDEVFYTDSCGNVANIYDATKVEDANYWREVFSKEESCEPGSSNADSASCGNCDYFLGSTCKEYERGEDGRRPNVGDHVCRDLSCDFEGREYQHGETFCANSLGASDNLPGSRHFRMVCYNGEITVEPCADYRQEVCLESNVEGFSSAACRANRWQDCSLQDKKKDCENTDRRDCSWVSNSGDNRCVPEFAPGFNFWSSDESGEAEDICSQISETCTIVYERGLDGESKCIENCHCEGEGWIDQKNSQCNAVGDCGVKVNYVGREGFNE